MKKVLDKLSDILAGHRWSNAAVSIMCILLSLLVASVLLLVLGKNPLRAYQSFLQGSGFLPKSSYGSNSGMISDFFAFLNYLAPMLLAALSFIVGNQTGLFNIGISGQMLAAGFVATCTVGYMDNVNGVVAKLLVVVVGIVVGGLLGALVGWLKYQFNINEVVSTIMINYIVNYVTGFAINNYFVDPISRAMKTVSSEARLTITNVDIAGQSCDIPLGIILALIAVFVIRFILDKTVFGFELKAVGLNRKGSEYTGIKVGSRLIWSMVISGMLAGLAGVTYYCGYTNTIVPKTLPDMGYDAITVALLGNSTPVGSIFGGILICIFQVGANYMSSSVGVVKEIASLITGIMLLFSACGAYFRYLASNRLRRIADEEARAAKLAAAAEGADGATVSLTEGALVESVQTGGDAPASDDDSATRGVEPPVQDARKEDEPNA